MSLGDDVRTYLMSKAAITSLIGTRMYGFKMPQKNNTFPCVVYNQISQNPAHVLSGAADYNETRLQFDCYGTSSISANAVAEALRNQLQGFPTTASSSMGSSTVTSCQFLGARSLYEPPQDNSDVGLYRTSADYWFRHDQSAPTFA